LSKWDLKNVTSIHNVLLVYHDLNLKGIEKWNVKNITVIGNILFDNKYNDGDLDLSQWDFNENVTISNMLNSATLKTIQYDKLLKTLSKIMIGSGRTKDKI